MSNGASPTYAVIGPSCEPLSASSNRLRIACAARLVRDHLFEQVAERHTLNARSTVTALRLTIPAGVFLLQASSAHKPA